MRKVNLEKSLKKTWKNCIKEKPKKLPPRTKEEKIGIKLMQDFLDGADYTGKKVWKTTKERDRLMNLGFKRFFQEEVELWSDR